MSEEALTGLRRAKELASECGGAHNVNTLSKSVIRAVQDARKKHEERKAREQEELRTPEPQNKENRKKSLERLRRKKKNWIRRKMNLVKIFLFFYAFLSRDDGNPRRVNYSDLQRGLDRRLRHIQH